MTLSMYVCMKTETSKTNLIIVLFEAANVRINTPKHVNAIAHPITFLLLPSCTSASQTNRSKEKNCVI